MADRSAEDEERESAEDDRNAGCVIFGLDCAFDGCLLPIIPFAIAFVWLLG